ncbi:hypothetical protein [Chryseobacterium balustinum]|uniref:SH3 domain-containing protein n=1 Tax=Chryseobacterium balustinum TaxID=246 RepID=A0ABY1LEU8_9FLAO|nr:hypothetical protein [Chryseobacterium balustinum]AZB32138.1 hypothetical protein EB354_22930 [Chryseobacterium balustinum]SKB93862.1 hypothetical protein SAMN05421800_11544 [Chryseobacterium balustinum]
MSYLNLEINRPLNGQEKKISAPTLKTGDRFVLQGDENLWFKLDIVSTNNQYLCSNEEGKTKLLDGDLKVTRINGICGSLNFHSKEIVKYFLENH